MTRSERIRLIGEIAKRMASEEWSQVDLILRQFGLPWSDQWDEDKNSYVITMIENASDSELAQLAQHFGIPETTDTPTDGNIGELAAGAAEKEGLIQEIEAQKALMIAVSTGGPRIQQVNEEYKERRIEIQSRLLELGIKDPNPYGDLWSWYGKWSDGSLQVTSHEGTIRRRCINLFWTVYC